jgi:DivIVA domain-containing protein
VGVRALSLVTDQPEHFSLSWRGYDRAEVEAFLERTAADRHRLHVDLAQLELALTGHNGARRQELERLAELRGELGQCLETSINALHVANQLLSSPARPSPERQHIADPVLMPVLEPASPRLKRPQAAWPLPSWLSPARTLTLVGVVSAGVVILPSLTNGYRPDGGELSAATQPVVGTSTRDAPLLAAMTLPLAVPVQTETSEPIAEAERVSLPPPPLVGLVSNVTSEPAATLAPVAESLVLTLTALDDCWIRSTIDGGDPRERLLKRNESLTLRASDEAVLRIGDPAALLLQINDRPAKTLGEAGRAVTARITRSNYLDFLSGN